MPNPSQDRAGLKRPSSVREGNETRGNETNPKSKVNQPKRFPGSAWQRSPLTVGVTSYHTVTGTLYHTEIRVWAIECCYHIDTFNNEFNDTHKLKVKYLIQNPTCGGVRPFTR